MSPPTVKITRSRTAQARLKSDQPTKQTLREIIRRADDGEKLKKRGKKLAGVRFADIGGGDLASTISLEDNTTPPVAASSSETGGPAVEKRSVGQTCQPRVHHTSCQVICCTRCRDLGHTAPLCITTDTSRGPSALYCRNCTMSYDYTDDSTITIKLTTCLAHQRSPKKKPKHDAAAKVLQKIDDMVAKGVPLAEVLLMMGISHEKFNKIKILVSA